MKFTSYKIRITNQKMPLNDVGLLIDACVDAILLGIKQLYKLKLVTPVINTKQTIKLYTPNELKIVQLMQLFVCISILSLLQNQTKSDVCKSLPNVEQCTI